ncbi:hypothetical protein ACFWY6_29935 [Streptomyces sp. NPDC059037]|uniref:hypothetical protein n=1 Tax=Streptomyces sp. NPDC059037 TaxID=3346710 RepID=UPI0036CE7C55
MGVLLGELGKRLAERWLSLLVLPGALYVAVAAAAVDLGHAHALDLGRLTDKITSYAEAPAVTTLGGQVVVLAAVLAGAAAIGVAAQGFGTLFERFVLAAGWRSWPRPLAALAHRWVHRRRRRWDAAHATWHTEYQRARAPDAADRPDPEARHWAVRDRNRIAVERPDRPTWSGDRIHGAALRLDREHHLDLATVWPHLWLALPDAVRGELTAARAALSRAMTLAAWAVLYAVLILWWWPAAPLALVLAVAARHRIRTATDTYAQLLEATTRVYAIELAQRLGIDHAGPLDQGLGRILTHCLRARLPRPPL